MKLSKTTIKKFRSINEQQSIDIDKAVTVLVGMNESGKTAFLKALSKSLSATGDDKFDVIEDYPRKYLTNYHKHHATNPDVVAVLEYEIDEADADEINEKFGTQLVTDFKFTVSHKYDNTRVIGIQFDEKSVIEQLSKSEGLSGEGAAAVKSAKTLREAEKKLKAMELTDSAKAILESLTKRIAATKWDNVPSWEVWKHLDDLIPKFMYFSDYDLLPGKMNMAELAQRVQGANANP